MTGVDVWAENLACVGLGPCYTPNFIGNVTVAVPEPGVVWVGMIGLWMMARRGRRIL